MQSSSQFLRLQTERLPHHDSSPDPPTRADTPSNKPHNSSSESKPLPPVPQSRSFLTRTLFPDAGWRPSTLEPPFLIFFSVLTIILIVSLEYLHQRSQAYGAVVFAPSIHVSYGFDYAPLAVAVLYGIFWASIDYDVKRLEPYFQLSRPDGVTAEHSLLLEYPYIFVPIAAWTALRKRHWAVFCSTLILVLITYGTTPLMSTVFSKANVERTMDSDMQRAGLMPTELQHGSLSTAFSYIAYSHQYLNGSLPPFTTDEYAVLPFQPAAEDQRRARLDETWIAHSTLYEARLECTAGLNETTDIHGNCSINPALLVTPISATATSPYLSLLQDTGAYPGGFADEEPKCKVPVKTEMLAAFFGRNWEPTYNKTNLPPFRNASTIFCRPVHEQQEVEAIIVARTNQIKEVRRIGKKTEFSGLDVGYWLRLLTGRESSASTADFNVSAANPLGNEILPIVSTPLHWRLPDHTSQLRNLPAFLELMGIYFPSPDTMTEFASVDSSRQFDGKREQPINVFFENAQSLSPFGLSKQSNLEELLDPNKLASAYSDAYRYLFAVAVGAGLAKFDRGWGSAASLAGSGTRIFKEGAYTVDPTWVRVLQAVLITVFFLNSLLTYLLWGRKCELGGEPGTIASSMVSVHLSVLRDFEDAEYMRPPTLAAALKAKGHRYCLRGQKVVACNHGGTKLDLDTVADVDPDIDRSKVLLSKPWELTTVTGTFSTMTIVGWVVLMMVLFLRGRSEKGFPEPTNHFVYDLYASYLPTIAATIFESFLVLLASQTTLLFPFKNLKAGQASAKKTLCVNYDKTPPHLQLFNAIRVRNGLLAILSLGVLLANGLAVALGGLFYKGTMDFQDAAEVTLRSTMGHLAEFNASTLIRGGRSDIDFQTFYVAAGKSFGFQPRPWTTDKLDLYYVPVTDHLGNRKTNYTFETWAMGANVSCEPIPETRLKEWHSLAPPRYLPSSHPVMNHTFSYITFSDKINISLLEESPEPMKTPHMISNDPLHYLASDFEREREPGEYSLNFNESRRQAFYEYAPGLYPKGAQDSKDWDFFASWIWYQYDEDREVVIDRVFYPDAYIGKPYIIPSDQSYLGKTVRGSSVFIKSRSIIRCKPRPRLVKAKLVADLDGNIIDHQDVEIPLTVAGDIDPELLRLNITTKTGLVGLLNTFHNQMLLVTGKIGSTFWYAPLISQLSTSSPTNWLTFLAYQHGRASNPDFDLFTSSEESAKSMAAAYESAFAVYLQLHSDQIFSLTEGRGDVASATYIRHETRVLMQPMAFYVAVSILGFFIPVVIWAYASLYHGFLCHQPTTLAGIYASIYASDALVDVKGTEMLEEGERSRIMDAMGTRYGYGWFIGWDRRRHVGIKKEPLIHGNRDLYLGGV